MEAVSLDSIDRKILATLQSEPDLSIAELGERVGLSQTPCWRRMRRLQDVGVLKERAWILDGDKLGLSVSVFAEVRLKLHDEETLEAFESQTRACREIVECFTVSGDSDYLMRIVVGSVSAYEQLLKKVLLHLPGVASVNSNFALNTVKMTTALPI